MKENFRSCTDGAPEYYDPYEDEDDADDECDYCDGDGDPLSDYALPCPYCGR